MLNSPFLKSCSESILALGKSEAKSTEQLVEFYYRQILAREPDEIERKWALEFFAEKDSDEEQAIQFIQALLASNEFAFID